MTTNKSDPGYSFTISRRDALMMTTASVALAALGISAHAQAAVTPAEARAIAKEATIWGYPLVDDHRIQYNYFIDRSHPEFKGDWNTIGHNSRLYTPDDKTIQTINSDTLYSFIGNDVRDEPIVISVPEVEKARYYGCSIFDLWGHCDMFGTRTTGNDAANFLIAGPTWKGETPKGIKKVFQMETTLGNIAFRTQLFNPDDLDKRQEGAGRLQGANAVGVSWPTRASSGQSGVHQAADGRATEIYAGILPRPEQSPAVRAGPSVRRPSCGPAWLEIGLTGEKPFEVSQLSQEMKGALEQGQADAWVEINAALKRWDAGELTPAECYGTREYLKNNYLNRTTAIVAAGNAQPKEEVVYGVIGSDSDGKPFNGANRYTIRFPGNSLPPAKAFWSVTMYDLPGRLARCQSDQPLSAQHADDAELGERPGWRLHVLPAE